MAIFFVFAIPFIWVKERKKKSKITKVGRLIGNSFKQLGKTFKEIRQHKELFKFVIGYFLIVEVANIVVIKMILIVVDGMKMEYAFANYFIIIATLSAVIFTYFIGILADRKGAKIAFIAVCALWGLALIIAIIASTVLTPIEGYPTFLGGDGGWSFEFTLVLIMGLLAGPAMGGTWVAQRYMIIELAPKEKFGEYFGFSKLSGKVSASIGPIIWGAIIALYPAVVTLNVAYAIAIAVVGAIMLAGLIIVLFVKPEKYILKEIELEPAK